MGQQAGQMADQAGQVAGQVKEQATQQVTSKLNDQKSRAAQGLDSAADSLAQMGEQMRQQNPTVANFMDTAGDKLREFSTHLEQRDVTELLDDVERYARRNPGIFVGGAFALGLLGARFLRSSGQGGNGSSGHYGQQSRYNSMYNPYSSGGYAGSDAVSAYGAGAGYDRGTMTDYSGGTTGATTGYTRGTTGTTGMTDQPTTTGERVGYGATDLTTNSSTPDTEV